MLIIEKIPEFLRVPPGDHPRTTSGMLTTVWRALL